MSVSKIPGWSTFSGQNPKCRSTHTPTADIARWTRIRFELQTRVKHVKKNYRYIDTEDARVPAVVT